MFHQQKNAFTLVELIITIAILFIISTIGMVSYLKFLPGVRDANRLQNIVNINEAVEEYKLQARLPKPTNPVNIKIGVDVIGWQGDLETKELATLGINKDIQDPFNDEKYTFYVDEKRKNIQFLAFLEETNQKNQLDLSVLSKTLAVELDYKALFPYVYGSPLGVYINNNNVPIQRNIGFSGLTGFDLSALPTTQRFQSIISNTHIISGSGAELLTFNPQGSCQRIKDNNSQASDGIYDIYLEVDTKILLYCDMTTQGGGWTLVHKTTDSTDDLTGALDTTEGIASWKGKQEFRLSIDYWKQLSTESAMAINIRTDGLQWEDVTEGYITNISNTGVIFSEIDQYRLFGYGTIGPDSSKICGTGNVSFYWQRGCCRRCVNFNSIYSLGGPSNSPVLEVGVTSFTQSSIEGAGGTNDSTWHRLKKMGIFLR